MSLEPTKANRIRLDLAAGVAAASCLFAFSASADLALLTNGDFLKVDTYEMVEEEKIRLDLRDGGSLYLPIGRVERIVDDEIVVVEEPPASPVGPPPETAPESRLELHWHADAVRPDTPYGALFFDAGKRFQLNPILLAAMARAESAYDPRALSVKGARGLLQLMPATAERFGVKRTELYDPQRNIEAASRYLNVLIKEFDGDLKLVLAAYNAGEGNVRKYKGVPPFRETRNYISRIYRFLGLAG